MDPKRELLRHILATIAYRGGKALRGAPEASRSTRPAPRRERRREIVAHLGDLFDWALSMAKGAPAWNAAAPLAWDEEVARFFAALEELDGYLASDGPLGAPAEQLFQGPLADALTHVGQLTMLRRLAGEPVRGENYFVADIAAGRVGSEQAAPRREFD